MVSRFWRLGDEMKKSHKSIIIGLSLIILLLGIAGYGAKKNSTDLKDGNKISTENNGAEENNKDVKDDSSQGNSGENSQELKNGDNVDESVKLDIKALEKNKVRIFSEKAMFGSTVLLKINDKSIEQKSEFYQIFNKSEPLTKKTALSKTTTMYPDAKIGTKVQVKFYDKNSKLLYSEEAIVENK